MDGAPKTIKEGVNKDEAETIKKKFATLARLSKLSRSMASVSSWAQSLFYVRDAGSGCVRS